MTIFRKCLIVDFGQ